MGCGRAGPARPGPCRHARPGPPCRASLGFRRSLVPPPSFACRLWWDTMAARASIRPAAGLACHPPATDDRSRSHPSLSKSQAAHLKHTRPARGRAGRGCEWAALRAPNRIPREPRCARHAASAKERRRRRTSATVRRGGATPAMAACRRNPTGWADPRRRAALLVARVLVVRVRHAPRAWRGLRLGPARPRGMLLGALS